MGRHFLETGYRQDAKEPRGRPGTLKDDAPNSSGSDPSDRDEHVSDSTFHASPCSFLDVMSVIGGKWRGTIIYCLSMGPRRFNELRREVSPITQKMLTQELKALAQDGLVARQRHSRIPPRVVYSLTELGESLIPIFESIYAWRIHYHAVARARASHALSETRVSSLDDSDD